MAICSVPSCEDTARSRGWCWSHYARNRAYGDPLAGGHRVGEIMAWVLEAITVETDECLFCPYGRKSNGYVYVTYKGKQRLGHHVVLMLTGRTLPPAGQETRHLCGNGHLGCLNKRHLLNGTRSEQREDDRRNGAMPVGERTYNAKLSEADVVAIRASDDTQRALARQFSVDQSTIAKIRARRSWRHVP